MRICIGNPKLEISVSNFCSQTVHFSSRRIVGKQSWRSGADIVLLNHCLTLCEERLRFQGPRARVQATLRSIQHSLFDTYHRTKMITYAAHKCPNEIRKHCASQRCHIDAWGDARFPIYFHLRAQYGFWRYSYVLSFEQCCQTCFEPVDVSAFRTFWCVP